MTTASAVARHYGLLTPEERFRLILAAGARADEAERGRLLGAGRRITLGMPDHAPYAHAFAELSVLIFAELLDGAAEYLEAFLRADGAEAPDADEVVDGQDKKDAAEGAEAGAGAAGPGEEGRSATERLLGVALAAGFLLKSKADGWKLFCARLGVPPLAAWAGLPGLARLERALALAERAAFAPEDMVRWLNDVRPAGAPAVTDLPWTAAEAAAGIERLFRERVAWWGGE
jgi:hypothetical protein